MLDKYTLLMNFSLPALSVPVPFVGIALLKGKYLVNISAMQVQENAAQLWTVQCRVHLSITFGVG